jgi:glyoxylase-like metal-dependent hydrolase (beta-lactamase superfamily II)
MSWLIRHEPTNTALVFDLGLPKDPTCLPPAIQTRLATVIQTSVPVDAADSLAAHGIDAARAPVTVLFSHLHYDHIGDARRFGPRARFVVGPGALALLDGPHAFPRDPRGHFHASGLPRGRTEQLPKGGGGDGGDGGGFWTPLGPFPRAHDWFGDASLFVVDAPGHLAGHVNLLCRIGREEWVCLAGDSCHDIRILNGEVETAVYEDPEKPGAMKCAHADLRAAEEHLERLRVLRHGGVEVILAHDFSWIESNPNRYR